MRARRWIKKQNSGFSLIELLVAITILAMLTIPLINSFITSGKINRNSRRLQNATAVAQSVAEAAKHTTNMAELQAVLTSMPGSPGITDISTGTTNAYRKDLTGADGEKFRVEVSLTPKTDYDYKNSEFSDLYNEANVIYSELILFDNSVITYIKNMDIPYTSVEAAYKPVTKKWDPSASDWKNWTPTPTDMKLRATFGNLFADEYAGDAIGGINNPDSFTKMNSKLKKGNIDKEVTVNIAQSVNGKDFIVTIKTAYYMDYEVIYRAEDTAADAEENAMAFYKYSGKLKFETDDTLTYNNKYPIYLLYNKYESDSLDDGGNPVVNQGHFLSTTFYINVDSSVQLQDDSGAYRPVELYLVEQTGPVNDAEFKIKIKNFSNKSVLNVYTNEVYDKNTLTNNTIAVLDETNDINEIILCDYSKVKLFSDKDPANTDNHVGYQNGDAINSLYKITVNVLYDAKGDGSYSESVYSVSTED